MTEPIITEKQLDTMAVALNPKCQLLVFEGQIRSSKTVVAIQTFFEAVQDSDEELHLLGATDLDAIRDNLLESPLGLLTLYPTYCGLRGSRIGGYYVEVRCDIPGKPRIKRVLLTGFVNKNKWKKVLSKTFGVILIDEVNTSDEQFVDECFARQVSVNNPLMLWTLNGDVPSHWIYTKYINTCKILGKCPASIRADMDKSPKVKGRYYMHWTMHDNPIMTAEKIARAASIYPVGSYYYQIKILGERGAPGKLIYLDYMSDKLITTIDISKYAHFGVGVDVGASRARNSFSLVGFSSDFSNCAVIDKMSFQQLGYDAKKEKLKVFVQMWLSRGVPIEYISVDSAEQNYIYDLTAEFKRLGLPSIISSYKATIKERIDLVIILMARRAMLFNSTKEGRECFDAFRMAKWVEGEEGKTREDLNEPKNDYMDSIEYALTRHMKKMIRAYKQDEEVA